MIVSGISLLLLAGGVAHPVECRMESCCCTTEITEDLALQQGHCGCGCGSFEESQVPDQSAVTVAVTDSKPLQSKFDYVTETGNGIFDDSKYCLSEQEISSHSPPLILDYRYTPLLC